MSEDVHVSVEGFLPPEEKLTAVDALEFETTFNFKEGHNVGLVKHTRKTKVGQALVSLEFLACLGNTRRGETYNWEKHRYE